MSTYAAGYKLKVFPISMTYRLLQAAIGGFSTFFPDYRERIARHEAAHFLGIFFPNFIV